MKIILLSGKPNTGKTQTLNMLYDWIMQDGGEIIDEKEKIGLMNDFKCVISFNKKKVAIFSMGDILRECVKAIIEYSNCDVLVLAYSDIFTKINLDKIIENFRDHHRDIKKTSSNEDDCKTIISELKY